jgi:hypothetical protein
MGRLKVLTVGDGDLTLSLSLARAYGDHISLTASVLDATGELLRAYPDAPTEELEQLNVPILFGLDATQLHQTSISESDRWELILFHHPHLGLATLTEDEAAHAGRHFRLLCHYLHAAQQVSKLVHVCLCGTQPQTWRLQEAAERIGMELLRKLPTALPFCRIWIDDDDLPAATAQPQFAAPRRYRNGKLGSRHFLGKYGYMHRRTEGDRYNGTLTDMNVSGSEHFVFRKSEQVPYLPAMALRRIACQICNTDFHSEQALAKHVKAPAKPEEHSTNYLPLEKPSEEPVKTTPNQRCESQESSKLDNTDSSSTDTSNIKSSEPISVPEPIAPAQAKSQIPDRGAKELVVSEEFAGKRLRWFIKHHIKDLSKRTAECSIQAGMVCIDGEAAKDSSRVLRVGNTVSVSVVGSKGIGKESPLEILYRNDPVVIVWKPAGLRTKGAFQGTLESTLSKQEGSTYSSLSSLETSCPGLCVLTKDITADPPCIIHVMTALVHGRVADDWSSPTDVSVAIKLKWNKRSHDGQSLGSKESVQISFAERMGESGGVSLSTVSIRAKTPSTSSICQFLRHAGFPVVGDMYCRQEYLNLKRSIRNRIKDKLSIGCYSLEINGTSAATKTPPEKLSARYWEEHLKSEKVNCDILAKGSDAD